MPDPKVPGMEPAAGEGFRGRGFVLQVALHDDVAAHEQFAHRLAILRQRRQGHGIGDDQRLLNGVGHALPGL